MGVDFGNLNQTVDETMLRVKSEYDNLKRLNMIVAGKTGAGKSTLINAMFRDKLADTGVGVPVTKNLTKIEKKDTPFTIYDTQGLELDAEVQEKVKAEILDTIKKGLTVNDENELIHCILYCVNTATRRVEAEEIELIKTLAANNDRYNVPVYVILTQAYSKKMAEEITQALLAEGIQERDIIPVLAEDYVFVEDKVKPAYGLDEVIKRIGSNLTEDLQYTLQNLQIVSLEEKRRVARTKVNKAVTVAAGIGAVPIPMADATLLVPAQIAMIAEITTVFGFALNKAQILGVISATIGAGGATILGKTLVTNLVKLIPGAGSLVGGAVSATVAASLTKALGEAYIEVMSLVYTGKLNVDALANFEGKELLGKLFKEMLAKQKKE